MTKKNETVSFHNGMRDVSLSFDSESQAIWATSKTIGEIFDTDNSGIIRHIQNIYESGELVESATTAKFAVVQNEGGRSVNREILHYNLDVILSVGYRVNSKKATAFRQWASQTLKAYLEQGYVINEQALRDSPEKLNQLAAKIRALRSEEKQVYAKVRECFKISCSDYDPSSKQVRSFYALLQDKFHHAVTGMTGAKLVLDRAHHTYENMGLQTISGEKPTLQDAQIGKNYLSSNEIYRLHILSEQFLLFAEATALANKQMTMDSLHNQLDRLLTLNDYPVFDGYKDFIKDQAIDYASKEFKLYQTRLKVESLGIEFDEESLENGEYDNLLNN